MARTPDDRFVDLQGYPFAPRYLTLDGGLRMHYVDEGPADGEAVLLLHGQPTWSYVWRKVIPVLTAHGLRAIAPDLIGFGRSDKPVARTDHTVRAHVAWLGEFLEQLRLSAVTLVGQDWGGPIGLGALVRAPQRFNRVMVANAALHTADAALAGRLTWACHGTPGGDMVVAPALLDYQRLTQELPVWQPSLFVQGATTDEVAPEVGAAYDAPFPDERSCAGARQLPLLMGLTPASGCARLNRRTLEFLRSFDRPFLTAFSDGDPSTAGWERVLQEAAAGARGRPHPVITGAGHFLQEDRGAELGAVVARFVQANPPSRNATPP